MQVNFVRLDADASEQLVEATTTTGTSGLLRLSGLSACLGTNEERPDGWRLVLDRLESHLHRSVLHLLGLSPLCERFKVFSEEDVVVEVLRLSAL